MTHLLSVSFDHSPGAKEVKYSYPLIHKKEILGFNIKRKIGPKREMI